jgi:histidine phosphotransfer protein HptB
MVLEVVGRNSSAALLFALITGVGGEVLAARQEPGVSASEARRRDETGLGRAVVISLALLFAGVSLGQLGLRRSRGRKGEAGESPMLDAHTPRSATVAKIFLQHAPTQVAALGQALDADDPERIGVTAHKLKGSCLAIGAPRMAELCALLEAGASGRAEHYAELCRSLVQAERELSEELVSGSGPSS